MQNEIRDKVLAAVIPLGVGASCTIPGVNNQYVCRYTHYHGNKEGKIFRTSTTKDGVVVKRIK